MLRDLEFFKTKLQHIDGFGDTADHLVQIIKSKQVKSASPPSSEKRSSGETPAEATKAVEEAIGAEEKASVDNRESTEMEVKNGGD